MSLLPVIAAGLLLWATSASAAPCRELDNLAADFRNAYPTGGEAARHAGARGTEIMRKLFVKNPGHAIVFLYSGDGPVTGARGRYLYTVIDERDCVVHHDWIDGEVYDQVLSVD